MPLVTSPSSCTPPWRNIRTTPRFVASTTRIATVGKPCWRKTARPHARLTDGKAAAISQKRTTGCRLGSMVLCIARAHVSISMILRFSSRRATNPRWVEWALAATMGLIALAKVAATALESVFFRRSGRNTSAALMMSPVASMSSTLLGSTASHASLKRAGTAIPSANPLNMRRNGIFRSAGACLPPRGVWDAIRPGRRASRSPQHVPHIFLQWRYKPAEVPRRRPALHGRLASNGP